MPSVLAEHSLHSAWPLVIPKGMFSGERRKESHYASKIQAAHIKAPGVPFHLQTGNAAYGILVLFCFSLFSYPDGWGEMEETYYSQQARESC